jgi:hypothetical protein
MAVRKTRTREPDADRRLYATFGSPRRAVEAMICLRRELPDVAARLRPLGTRTEGAEPEIVAVDARVPWRWCRAAVLLLVGIDATARLEWGDAVTTKSGRADR